MKIDVLLDVKTTLGEGPVWDVDQQRLYFIDSMDGRVFRCTADGTEIRAWDVPGKIGSMALRKNGEGAIVSLDKGFWLLDFESGECDLLEDPEEGNALIRTIFAAILFEMSIVTRPAYQGTELDMRQLNSGLILPNPKPASYRWR